MAVTMRSTLVCSTVVVLGLVSGLGAQLPVPPVPGQARDAQGQPQVAATGTGLIAGRATLVGSGQPLGGVRVTLSAAEIRGSRSVLTDDDGQFVFTALPPGSFTVRGTLAGHIAGTFGQKQPGRQGTPIVLADGQQFKSAAIEIAKGGVISGAVYDEKNRPSIGTSVRVLRWVLVSGERTISVASTATTDDRGIFRAYNLQPGEYLVAAAPRNTANEIITTADLAAQERLQQLATAGLAQATPAAPVTPVAAEPVQGYAPVFFPGTTQLAGARAIKVGVSEEQLGIDFQLQRAPITRVTGQVILPAGQSPTTAQVRLQHLDGNVLGVGQQSVRPQQNGTFTFQNVVPGQYLILATSSASSGSAAEAERVQMLTMELQRLQGQGQALPAPVPMPPTAQTQNSPRRLWAQAEVFVDGGYPPAVTLTLQEGLSLSGSVTFEGGLPLPQGNQRPRVTMNPLGSMLSSMGLGSSSGAADPGGRFAITGLVPGRYRISAAAGAQGWQLRSVMVGGVDVLDFPLEIAAGQPVAPLTVQFTDRSTDLKGVMTGADGQASAEYSVVIFPEDPRYWVPFARRMRATRPSTDGRFGFLGLPPGDYRLAAVTDLDSGEIFDPEFLRQLMPASVAVRLIDGQPTTRDIQVR